MEGDMAKAERPKKRQVNLKVVDKEQRKQFTVWIKDGIKSCENAVDSLQVQYKAVKLPGIKENIKYYKNAIAYSKWLISRMDS